MSSGYPRPIKKFKTVGTIKRPAAGSYVDMVWQDGTVEEIPVIGSLQQARPDEIVNQPEAQRQKQQLKLYTDMEVLTVDEVGKSRADHLEFTEYPNKQFEAQRIDRYKMGTLDHNRVWLVELDRNDGEI